MIPAGPSNQPVLDIDVILNNLEIYSNADLELADFDLDVGGVFKNNGTMSLYGAAAQTVSLTMDTDSGTVEYNGPPGPYNGLRAGNAYYNLTINQVGSSYLLLAPVTVNHNLTVTAGELDLNGQNLNMTASGTVSNSDTSVLKAAKRLLCQAAAWIPTPAL